MRAFRLGRAFAGLLGVALLAISTSGAAADKRFFSWGSFSSGTSQYVYVGMIIGLAREHLPDVSLTNEASSGTTHNLDLLDRGEIELAIASPERLHSAHFGSAKYEGDPVPVTTMWVMNEQATILFTKADAGIESFEDLAGRRVAIGPAGSSNEIKNSAILEAYGYTRVAPDSSDFEELTTVKLSLPEAASALAEGAVDASMATQPLPEPAHAELALRTPLRLIGVEPGRFDAVAQVYPWLWETEIPADTYAGQDEPLVTLGDRNYVIASAENLPDDVAYELTRLYVETLLPQMAEQQANLKVYAKDPERLVAPWVIPGHPGAVRYYEEAGLDPRVVEVE